MDNVQIEMKEDKTIITIDLSKEFGESKSSKDHYRGDSTRQCADPWSRSISTWIELL